MEQTGCNEPVIEFSPKGILFNIEGAPPLADQEFRVRNDGAGTLNWQITYSDCDWLTVTPTSGSSIGEADDVTLSVDPSGLTEPITFAG